jgi:hypothetical protein
MFGCIVIFLACQKIREENYFLPKNYDGYVAIIYNKADSGQREVYNFHIPEDGILRSSYAFSPGDYQIHFYQKTENNKYDTLLEELPGSKYDTSKARIYFNHILTFSRPGQQNIYRVTVFYVGKKAGAELEKETFFFENRIEQMLFKK